MKPAKAEKKKREINQLIKKYYKGEGILSRDQLLEKEILASVSSNSKVLDVGCGYDAAVISKYCDSIGEAVGIDLLDIFKTDPRVKTYTANLENLPFKNDYFDLIISRNVCEHLAKPVKVFGELRRVLKPGGRMIMVAPNKYYYSSVISGLLPIGLKKYFLRNEFGEKAHKFFPVYYRCNTKLQINKISEKNKLRLIKFIAIRHYPCYLRFSVILFKLGILYDRLISALCMDCLQSSFLFVLAKE